MFWNPRSCDCRLEVDARFRFVDWQRKCELHRALDNTALLTAVLAHNNALNAKFGSLTDLTRDQIVEISNDRIVERERIRTLGSGIER